MRRLFMLSICLLGTSFYTAPACTLDFPDTLGTIVDRGDKYLVRLIEYAGGGAKTAETKFFVQASREKCWKVITDYRHYPEFIPNIKAAKQVRAPKGSANYAFVLGAGLLNINYTISFSESRNDSAGWSLAWTYIEGDIRSTTGSWNIRECKEMPGWTVMCYKVRVDVGSLMPAWLSTMLTTKSIPGLIKAVRERAVGKKRPKG